MRTSAHVSLINDGAHGAPYKIMQDSNWSECEDLNLGPSAPRAVALPGCATLRKNFTTQTGRGSRIRTLVDRDSEKRSACHVRVDHGGVANTRDSPTIAAFCALPCSPGTCPSHSLSLSQSTNGRIQNPVPGLLANPLFNWCARRDLNPQSFRHWFLRPACIPIPPHAHSTLSLIGMHADALTYWRKR